MRPRKRSDSARHRVDESDCGSYMMARHSWPAAEATDRSLIRKIRDLPKVDLHRHLTGSISARAAIAVARRHSLPLPVWDEAALDQQLAIHARPGSLRDYFRPWTVLNDLFTSTETTFELVSHVLAEAAADNVVYLELRMAPRSLVADSNLPLTTFLEAASSAIAQAQAPITRGILGLPRHALIGQTSAELRGLFQRILNAIRDHGNGFFVGVDLNGDEALADGSGYRWFFESAKDAGLRVTVHAGELGSAENVRIAIAELGADRIGHGTAALRDLNLTAELAWRGTVLEVCPTSNVLLGVFPTVAALPIWLMKNSGVRFTINTDNPARCRTTLSNELHAVARAFDFSIEDICELTRTAMDASFLDDRMKVSLVRRLADYRSLQRSA